MNYLGHAWLSFGNPQLLVGNMISDFVKGRSKFQYPACIQQGIMLHRKIDSFTDSHASTLEARKFFRQHYGLYSTVIMDVIFDHYLARASEVYIQQPLEKFSQQVYATLEDYATEFPPRFAVAFSYMKVQNWLLGYRHKEGVYKSLSGLARRASYMPAADEAYRIFQLEYDALQQLSSSFLQDVKSFAKDEADRLL